MGSKPFDVNLHVQTTMGNLHTCRVRVKHYRMPRLRIITQSVAAYNTALRIEYYAIFNLSHVPFLELLKAGALGLSHVPLEAGLLGREHTFNVCTL